MLLRRVLAAMMGEIALATYIARFVETCLFAFTVSSNVSTASATCAVTCVACELMVTTYALGGVADGNSNPAASLALRQSEKMLWTRLAVRLEEARAAPRGEAGERTTRSRSRSKRGLPTRSAGKTARRERSRRGAKTAVRA